MKIDRENSLPLYIQIRENIRAMIERGEIKTLEPLPSEDALCKQYQVSRMTIKKALQDLKKEGYIIRIKRKGTFVNAEGDRIKKEGRGIFQSEKQLFAFIVPDIEDIFITDIFQGIKEVAREQGYEIVIFSSNKDIETEVSNIELLEESRVKGAIIFPFWGRFNAYQILKLKKKRFPFVLIDRYFRDIETDRVVVDNHKGAFQAVKYLINLGHNSIAHIMGVLCTSNEDRFEGYRAALNEAHIHYNSAFTRMIQPFQMEESTRFEPDDIGGYKEALALLSQKEIPTAIFAGNDYIALGCYRAIKEKGLKIPEDISVVGFDDLKFSSHLEVPLTTVRQQKYEIGRLACEILIKRIEGKIRKDKVEQITLPTELIIRESCSVPPHRNVPV